MALSASLLGAITFVTTGGSQTVVATPAVGDMIVVIVAATGVASGLGVIDNNTDGHGGGKSYTQIASAVKNTSADQMAAFVRADPIRKAVSTTWTTSGDSASTGGGLYVMHITGATISGPFFIRQSGVQSNGAAAGTPTVALGTGAALTANALITAVFNAAGAAPGITVPTSWAAADVNAGYITPSAGIEGTHINSAFTGSTVTWGSTSATAFCALAFEMRADAGRTSVFPAVGGGALDITLADSPKLVAVKRGAFF